MVVAYRQTREIELLLGATAFLGTASLSEPRYAVHGGVFKPGCGFLGTTYFSNRDVGLSQRTFGLTRQQFGKRRNWLVSMIQYWQLGGI